MAPYGGFSKQRAHSLGALTSVFEARSSETGTDRVALKIFHPPASTQVRRLLAIEGWLLAAERQQAAGRSQGALEVLAWGRCEEGAFSVMPWRSTLEPLVESMQPKGDRLRALAERLLGGLATWEECYGGPHGKLKPANVFLHGEGLLGSRTPRFSDPWSTPGMNVGELRRRDLGQVGAMLVQVVRGREAAGWPIEDAPEWAALGRPGAAWREYCNYLLNPAPVPANSIAEARSRLQRIPRDARPGRTAWRAAAGVVGITTAGTLAFGRFGNPDAMPERWLVMAEALGNPRAFRVEIAVEWPQLCRAWGTWVGDALRNSERWERTEGLWSESDPLLKALAAFRTEAATLDPRVVVPEAAGSSLGVLADSPPTAVREELLRGSVDRRVRFAWNQVRALGARLETWPRWAELSAAADQMQEQGFPRVASAVRQRLPGAAAGEAAAMASQWRALNEFSQDRDGLLALLPRWQALQAVAGELVASGDRVQAALPRLALASVVDRRSVGDFADTIAALLAELRRRRAQFVAPEVARERFLREASVLKETGEVTSLTLAAWETELQAFSLVGPTLDPRAGEDWAERLRRIQSLATELEAEAPPAEPGVNALSRSEFDAQLARRQSELAALRGRALLQVDLPEVAAEVARLRASVGALEQGVDATLALLRPERWLNRMTSVTWRYAASEARWRAWRGRELVPVTVTLLEQDRARFRQLRVQAQAVREWLQEFEGSGGLGGLEATALATVQPTTREAVLAWVEERGEQVAASALAAATWTELRPAETWPAAAARAPLQTVLAAHGRWLAAVPALAEGLDRLGMLLEVGFGWDAGVREAVAGLGSGDDLATLQGRPAAWLAEARALADVAASTDRATLVRAAAENGFALKLTAWRRLGALAEWPAGRSDLDTDGALVAGLRQRIQAAVTDEGRRSALQEELARETRRRWNRAARHAAGDEAELTAAFERMDRFGIAERDLEPAVAYNFRLWQLKHTDWDQVDLDQVRTRRDDFVASVRQYPDVANEAAVARLMSGLAALALREDAGTTASSPRRAGWVERLAEGGQRVTVSWSASGKRVELEYQLVLPKDGTAPFYLARRAIAVGEFIDLLSAHANGAVVLEAMPAWVRRDGDGSEPWTAPMGWRPRADHRGVELNPGWIYRPDAQVAPLLAPEMAAEPALRELHRERPTLRSPLQRLSPEAARLFAERVLGARLPSRAEWRALMAVQPSLDGANLRDGRFRELWSYLDGYRVANQTISWRPNQGIFLPLQSVEVGARTRRLPLRDGGEAQARGADGYVWLAPVDEGPELNGFIHLLGNVWTYLVDPAQQQDFYVAGGSALSPPSLDPTQPQRVEGVPLIGSRGGRALVDGFTDVGLRPAFDAPPGLRDRFEMLRLVRVQQFLTL